ncbi:MAG: hypothetical protein IPL26_08075 [Leptospiraceae bacterium]|nr:hypothetical protein [Leptospiraceae bacterium]
MKKFPIRIEVFSEIITGNYYIKKTNALANHVSSEKSDFLFINRRFEKNLIGIIFGKVMTSI